MSSSKYKSSDYLAYIFIAPAIILFMCYGILGQWLESTYQLKDLKAETGIVTDAKLTFSKTKKGGYTYCIEFEMNRKIFRIRNLDKNSIKSLLLELENAESVAVWRRNRMQQLLGMGWLRDVYQLSIDKRIIIPLEQTRNDSTFIWKFILPLVSFLFALWVFSLYKYYSLKLIEISNKTDS